MILWLKNREGVLTFMANAFKSGLDFIMRYYGWALGGSILILLAIIGSYAEKINFGQGKDDQKEDNKKIDLGNQGLKDLLEHNTMEQHPEKSEDVVSEILSGPYMKVVQ